MLQMNEHLFILNVGGPPYLLVFEDYINGKSQSDSLTLFFLGYSKQEFDNI